ncbi:hypothetical protein, partial [Fervidibacter sp.]
RSCIKSAGKTSLKSSCPKLVLTAGSTRQPISPHLHRENPSRRQSLLQRSLILGGSYGKISTTVVKELMSGDCSGCGDVVADFRSCQ